MPGTLVKERHKLQTRTPETITPAISALCCKLVSNPQPVYLSVTPAPGADPSDCFVVVQRQVRERGGALCCGWLIWEWAPLMIEAEFHATWRDSDGKLHEMTPQPSSIKRTLFLPDPARSYEGRRVNNVRRPLSSNPLVAEFINLCDAEFEFMNCGERAQQHGSVSLGPADSAEYVQIQRRKFSVLRQLGILEPEQPTFRFPMSVSREQTGRNEPCPCGSDKKFKKCCGR